MFRERMRFIAFLAGAIAGCSSAPPAQVAPGPGPPDLIVGRFEDDYSGSYTLSAREWMHGSSRYHVVKWNLEKQYLIARNDGSNPSAPLRWTRIDWMPLTGMPPYEWAFCMTAFNAPSAEAAEAITIARRDTPQTGCNGYPFSRMRRVRQPPK